MRLRTLCLLVLALAGCATAPPTVEGPDFSATLEVCPGGGVSNAPATDAARRVAGFEQLLIVRGVMLARAPVEGCLSSGYGPRRGGASNFHAGIDLYTGAARAVLAAGDGVVEYAGRLTAYGETVTIRHRSGVATRYAHLSAYGPGIVEGARVRAGDLIGRTGRTGNATAVHLHYEVLVDDATVNPLTVGR